MNLIKALRFLIFLAITPLASAGIFGRITSTFNEVAKFTKNVVDKTSDAMVKGAAFVEDAAVDVGDGIMDGVDATVKVAKDLGEGVESVSKDVYAEVKDVAEDVGDGIMDGVDATVNIAKTVGKGVADTFKDVHVMVKDVAMDVKNEYMEVLSAIEDINYDEVLDIVVDQIDSFPSISACRYAWTSIATSLTGPLAAFVLRARVCGPQAVLSWPRETGGNN